MVLLRKAKEIAPTYSLFIQFQPPSPVSFLGSTRRICQTYGQKRLGRRGFRCFGRWNDVFVFLLFNFHLVLSSLKQSFLFHCPSLFLSINVQLRTGLV